MNRAAVLARNGAAWSGAYFHRSDTASRGEPPRVRRDEASM